MQKEKCPKFGKILSLLNQTCLPHNNKMAAAVHPPAFDAAALTLFWEDADSMSLSHCTCVQLAVKGITEPEDLEEYDEAGLEKKPPKVAREVEPFKVTGKAKQRLLGGSSIGEILQDHKPPLDTG